jgi:hypothetical protein
LDQNVFASRNGCIIDGTLRARWVCDPEWHHGRCEGRIRSLAHKKIETASPCRAARAIGVEPVYAGLQYGLGHFELVG